MSERLSDTRDDAANVPVRSLPNHAYSGSTTPAITGSGFEPPWLLTVEEVATLLRTSRKAIYAMAERGLLPGVTRVGRRILVRRDDLLHWLRQKSAPSPKE